MKPRFTRANKYIFDRKALQWSLPSGHTCIGALKCLARADRETGRLTLGDEMEFKCYSAELERFPSVRQLYWANYEAVANKASDEVAATLLALLPLTAHLVRVHVAGDFFSQAYFDGWLAAIRQRPSTHFYAFTKSVPLWIRRRDEVPPNFVLTASHGGKWDAMIEAHGLKSAKVVGSRAEAESLALPVDTDDRLAAHGRDSFALVENRQAAKDRRVALTVGGKA